MARRARRVNGESEVCRDQGLSWESLMRRFQEGSGALRGECAIRISIIGGGSGRGGRSGASAFGNGDTDFGDTARLAVAIAEGDGSAVGFDDLAGESQADAGA